MACRIQAAIGPAKNATLLHCSREKEGCVALVTLNRKLDVVSSIDASGERVTPLKWRSYREVATDASSILLNREGHRCRLIHGSVTDSAIIAPRYIWNA